MARTEIHLVCILRTPFDVVFSPLSEYRHNPGRPLQTNTFYEHCPISTPEKCPNMIFRAFEVKFAKYNDGLSLKAQLKSTVKQKPTRNRKHFVESAKFPQMQSGGSPGGGSPPKKSKLLLNDRCRDISCFVSKGL